MRYADALGTRLDELKMAPGFEGWRSIIDTACSHFACCTVASYLEASGETFPTVTREELRLLDGVFVYRGFKWYQFTHRGTPLS